MANPAPQCLPGLDSSSSSSLSFTARAECADMITAQASPPLPHPPGGPSKALQNGDTRMGGPHGSSDLFEFATALVQQALGEGAGNQRQQQKQQQQQQHQMQHPQPQQFQQMQQQPSMAPNLSQVSVPCRTEDALGFWFQGLECGDKLVGPASVCLCFFCCSRSIHPLVSRTTRTPQSCFSNCCCCCLREHREELQRLQRQQQEQQQQTNITVQASWPTSLTAKNRFRKYEAAAVTV